MFLNRYFAIGQRSVYSIAMLFTLFLNGWQPAWGQQFTPTDSIDATTHLFDNYPLISKFYVRKPYNQNLIFFSYTWNKGTIHFEDGQILENILINYDRMDDQLVWMRGSDFKMGIVDQGLVKGFVLRNDSLGSTCYFEKEERENSWDNESFYQVLTDGFIRLRVRRKVTTHPELQIYNRFFLTMDGVTQGFALNRSSFISKLGAHKKEMRQIIRKNRLQFANNEGALIKAVMLFNERRPAQ